MSERDPRYPAERLICKPYTRKINRNWDPLQDNVSIFFMNNEMYERAMSLVGFSEHSHNSLRPSARLYFRDDACIWGILEALFILVVNFLWLWRTLKSLNVWSWTFKCHFTVLSSTLQTSFPLLYLGRSFFFYLGSSSPELPMDWLRCLFFGVVADGLVWFGFMSYQPF